MNTVSAAGAERLSTHEKPLKATALLRCKLCTEVTDSVRLQRPLNGDAAKRWAGKPVNPAAAGASAGTGTRSGTSSAVFLCHADRGSTAPPAIFVTAESTWKCEGEIKRKERSRHCFYRFIYSVYINSFLVEGVIRFCRHKAQCKYHVFRVCK